MSVRLTNPGGQGCHERPRSALFGHRGWLSEIGVLHFSLTHLKKKDKIEKEGLKKRNREKINTKVGQPI